MDHAELVADALARPGATEDEPWDGDTVAEVGAKIFVVLGGNGLGGSVRRVGEPCPNCRTSVPG
ncbi:hypothetical protein [Pseudonocardia sp. N23]|uniref:hypothetical protein n=1 Tax=Pseudonocardia sp. N23 TaxID=1987376 RepID=UPI000BFC9D01|nr:hypothetical protein [Pseudonocardia sp. N23]GAY09520.1 hypothetical protein TOK_3786 [Pseudonocardia sp. N23]